MRRRDRERGQMGRRRDRERGQSLVEMAMVLPVFLLILLGMVELGFAMDHNLTLNYASREGARMGAALADGSKLPSPYTCADADKFVMSAIERVLTSDGSPVSSHLADITSIKIFKADAAGNQTGSAVNTWVPGAGPTVDGRALHFVQSGVTGWPVCGVTPRSNKTTSPDSIGIGITYTYRFVTPLGGILRFFGGNGASTLPMTDRTVMALNPTN